MSVQTRHWLDYDPVALVVLLAGASFTFKFNGQPDSPLLCRCPARNLGSGSISPDREGHIDLARRERPRCGRVTDERDELAPFHCPTASRASHQNDSTSRTAGDRCAAGFQSGQ